ncbi:hypothetical protein [Schaalia vaccimaxillae]|uniref:hypothetical protein n=1 Tax=Schaalia vaccimaxillae TaxID=183916 RepID=UPI0003B361A7|nr:hypothetical protein [Schaalia vaccimaxillae]
MDHSNDRIIVIEVSGRYSPSPSGFPSYTVSRTWVQNGELVASVRGVDLDGVGGFPRTILRLGDTVADPKAGSFTLIDVVPSVMLPGEVGSGGGSATFRYQPAAEFDAI